MRHISLVFLFCCAFCLAPAGALGAQPGPRSRGPEIPWRTLLQGLELAELPLSPPQEEDGTNATPALPPENTRSSAVALRIDIARYTFTLHMASQDRPRSLPDLARRHGLVAAINAGMFLPDMVTSTGHLRDAGHVNNPRVVEKFGAFLVAGPKVPGLPRAALLDRTEDDWQKALQRYSLAVQNYRLNNAQGKVLWSEDGPPHSIAALSQDSSGRILFLLAPEPVRPAAFAAALLRLPLGLRTIMYLEGGSQAMLLVRAGNVDKVWVGRRGHGFLDSPGQPDALLPNVLGLRPRAAGE
jgi:hypothetical protein